MLHQWLHRKVEGTRDNYLSQSETPRFLNQFVSSGEHRRLHNFFKEILCKVTNPILRLAFVSLEVEIVKNFSAILIGDCEDRKAKESGCALAEALEQSGLSFGVEAERVHEIRADQSSFEIVECCPCQARPPDSLNRFGAVLTLRAALVATTIPYSSANLITWEKVLQTVCHN